MVLTFFKGGFRAYITIVRPCYTAESQYDTISQKHPTAEAFGCTGFKKAGIPSMSIQSSPQRRIMCSVVIYYL